MKSQRPKMLQNDGTDIVLFFIRSNKVFPVVIPDCSLIDVKRQSLQLERYINATYSGRTTTVENYNRKVMEGRSPTDEVLASFFEESEGALSSGSGHDVPKRVLQ